jgi:hypothetical protein
VLLLTSPLPQEVFLPTVTSSVTHLPMTAKTTSQNATTSWFVTLQMFPLFFIGLIPPFLSSKERKPVFSFNAQYLIHFLSLSVRSEFWLEESMTAEEVALSFRTMSAYMLLANGTSEAMEVCLLVPLCLLCFFLLPLHFPFPLQIHRFLS